MTTLVTSVESPALVVVEAYRLDRYDNILHVPALEGIGVVEAYRLDRYDNFNAAQQPRLIQLL